MIALQEITSSVQQIARGYTAPEILLFIGAIAALLVQTIGAWRNGARSIDTNTKVNETLIKAAVIEGHVNSKETKYVEQITALSREIEILNKMMQDKDRTAALLAQSVNLRVRAIDNLPQTAEISKEPQEVTIVNPKDDPVNVKEGDKKNANR